MKILICIGTRPEAIKLAPICHELRRQGVNFRVVATGQHFEMLKQVFIFFEIFPDHNMEIMQEDQSLNMISSRILSNADEILELENPDILLVQGDTTSAAMFALAAFNKRIPVAHVEAGLRTFNKKSPYPEEVNRQLISVIADVHFAPVKRAFDNLISENVSRDCIHLTGNTVVDALNWSLKKINNQGVEINDDLKKLLDPKKKLILVTGHRRENLGHGLSEICDALKELSKIEDVEIIYPVHLNPNVKRPVHNKLKNIANIHLVDPVTYPEMIWLMKNAKLIISDSGGIQEEAPSFLTPLLVTRNVSERMEVVEMGLATLVGTDRSKICTEAKKYLNSDYNFSNIKNPYGNGNAALKIVNELLLFST